MTALTVQMPSLAGSLEAYVQAVNRLPLLSADEEVRLGRQLRDEGDLDAARQLVLSHLRLVVSIARGYAGYGLQQADLIQEGNIGLMKAVKRFDPERGVRLVSFAMHWVRAEMHEFILRNWRLVRLATTKAQRKLFFNLRSMKSGLDTLSPADVQRVAAELQVRPEDVSEMETRLSGGDVALEPSQDDEDSYAPIAWLAAPETAEPARIFETSETERRRAQGLVAALAELDPRSRRIIEARWLAADAEQATLHDLAAEFGVSAERIRQVEAKALLRMKAHLGAD